MDAAAAAPLAAALERLGGVVRLTRHAAVPRQAAPAPPPLSAAPVGDPARGGIRISARSLRLAAIIAIGAFCIVRQLGAPQRILPAFPESRRGPAHAGPTPKRDPRYEMNVLLAPIRRQIATGDLDGAQQALDAVLAEHDDAEALALQGQLNERRGDLVAARVAYERSVELGGEDADVFLKLSAMYRQQGLQGRAVDMLHRAEQSGARGQDFQAMKQVVAAEQQAEAGYDSLTSPHFAVSFSGGEDAAAARLILSQLEDAYLVVGHKLGQYPGHRTPVVLYPAQEFQRVTHSPGWAGALYDGRIKVPVGGLRRDDPELARTIRHEYAHSLIIALSGGKCPVWLNEGVAMWAEDDRDGERESWALGILQMQPAPTLARLETSFMRMRPEQAAAAYAQSYLAARHLVARYGDRSLQNLLAAFATSADTAAAFREALPIELSSFEDDLRRQYDGG
jgi:Flp pilus assembly protein TadD